MMTPASELRAPAAHAPAMDPACPPRFQERRATGVMLALLGLLVCAFYYQLWWPDRVLIKRDATMTFLPIKQYLSDRLRAGELPEWFPQDAAGRPFIGTAMTGVFHPFTLLYCLLSAAEALRLSTLLCCLLAAGGAFGLGRHLGLSRAGALLAGFAFAASGYVASMTENIQYLYGICLAPLFLLALDKALAGGRPWTVAAAALWATVFLNGDIQTGYYLGWVAVVWAALRAPQPVPRALGVLSVAALLAVLLAGIQLGPALSVYWQGNVRESSLFQEQALQWSTHPLRMLTVLAWPFSTESDLGDVTAAFFGGPAMSPWAESLYLGAPVLGLALLGAARRRDLRVFTVLGLLALLFALGRYGGLYELFRHTVPLWSAFRYPEKWMGFASLAAAMLAGAGLDALREDRRGPAYWVSASCVGITISLLLRTASAETLLASLHETSVTMARDVAGTWAGAWLVSGATAGGVGLLITAAGARLLRPELLVAGVAAITVMDLTTVNIRAYFTAPRAMVEFTPPFLQALAAREGPLTPGRFRVASLRSGNRVAWPKPLEERFGYHAAAAVHFRQALNGGMNSEWGIEGFRPTLPGASAAVDAAYYRLNSLELFARLNVSYLIGLRSATADPRLLDHTIADLPEYGLFLARNPVPAKPRAYLSRKPEAVAIPPAPAELFARPDFLSGEVDVIETDDALPAPAAAGHAVVEAYAPERVVVRTENPAPAVLVLVDAFDPGWRAALDTGEALPVLRANLLMRAVVVPAGAHRVTFVYHTPLLTAGAAVSAAGLLLALAVLAQSRLRRARPLIGPKGAEHVPLTAG